MGKVSLQQRVSDFLAGRWSSLLAAAHASRRAGRARAVTDVLASREAFRARYASHGRLPGPERLRLRVAGGLPYEAARRCPLGGAICPQFLRAARRASFGTTPRAHATLFTKAKVASKDLAPAIYALGQHDALLAARTVLQEGEFLAAFLEQNS